MGGRYARSDGLRFDIVRNEQERRCRRLSKCLINAEVASTQEQRAIGLMNRPAMPANDGMLFVFERPGEQCFWMKNTLLPLSIAFLDEDGTIINIADMKPQTLDSHCSAKPVRFALEMNQGWFAKRALKAGTRLKGAPFGGR